MKSAQANYDHRVIAEFEHIFTEWQAGTKDYDNFLKQIEAFQKLSNVYKLKNLEASVQLVQKNLPRVQIQFIDVEAIFEMFEEAILSDVPAIIKAAWG